MASVEELIETVTAEFPDLVIDLSGPWKNSQETGRELDGPVWICNFKRSDLFNEYLHPGSSAPTPAEALEAGLAYAREWRAGQHARAL